MSFVVLVLGGTGDALRLSQQLIARYCASVQVIYSLVGLVRRPSINCRVHCGGFSQYAVGAAVANIQNDSVRGLAQFCFAEKVRLIIDATHPYAQKISQSAVTAATFASIPCWQYQRPPWTVDCRNFTSWLELTKLIADYRYPFFTLGQEPMLHLECIPEHQHWLIRTAVDQAQQGKGYQVMQGVGPFTLKNELYLLQRHQIDILICKNSGGEAVSAKLAAANACKIPILMQSRPVLALAERSFDQIQDVVNALDKVVNQE